MKGNLSVVAGLIVGLGLQWSCTRAGEGTEGTVGIRQLSLAEIGTMKEAAGWSKFVNNQWEVVGGIELYNGYAGDLAANTSFHVRTTVQRSPNPDGKERMLVIANLKEFTIGERAFTRLSIVSAGAYDQKSQTMDAVGDEVNSYQDPSAVVGRKNRNQKGRYLLLEPSGGVGIAFVNGRTLTKVSNGEEPTELGGILLTSSVSPFVALSSKTKHTYFMPVPYGSHSYLSGYHVAGIEKPVGMPLLTSAAIASAGRSEEFTEEFQEKLDQLSISTSQSEAAMTTFSLTSGSVKTIFGGWPIMTQDVVFVQPPAPGEIPVPDENAHGPQRAVAEPESEFTLRQTDNLDPQEDLSCNGEARDGAATMLPFSEENMVLPGWKYVGNVIATAEQHEVIFGSPEDLAAISVGRYLEKTQGYCLLSTGNSQFKRGESTSTHLVPVNNRRSEMAQLVKVPLRAKSIQVRAAFFTQEFPEFIESPLSDSFYVKFDESMEFIASGALNSIGAGTGKIDPRLNGCATTFDPENSPSCGVWESLASVGDLPDDLWNINYSSHAVQERENVGCTEGKSCYHGWVKPRVICKDLQEEEIGEQLTLRISITDVGDDYFDSALAVDSVVFSQENCAETFTREPKI